MATNNNILQDRNPDYEKAENDYLKEALLRSYTQRFEFMANLIKMNIMFSNATIKHQHIIPDNNK